MIEFKTDLFPYQAAGVEKLIQVKVGAMYMDMGTGKTRTALELAVRRLNAGKVDHVLWLCPYSVVLDLPELLAEHVAGFNEYLTICGIETLSTSTRENARLLRLVSSKRVYLIVDESLLVKNPTAYRTQNIIRISNRCEYKLILNGTPVSRNEADLSAQWYVLDWRILGYRSYWSFAANHLEFDIDHPGRIVHALNVDYLAAKIAPYTYEVQKNDVLTSLPPRNYQSVAFYLSNEQEEHYSDVSETLLAQVEEFRPETIYRMYGALQAIASGFAVQLNEKGPITRYVMYPPDQNPRIKKLMTVLERFGDEQVVIYCQYTQEITDIIQTLNAREAECAVPFYGELSQLARQQNKNSFRDGKARYFVANKACAKFGLNLQFCWNEVFYSNDWEWGTRVQAEDRIYRPGQTHPVTVVDLYAANTLDETILKCLGRKEGIAVSFREAVRKNNDVKGALRDILRGGAKLIRGKEGVQIAEDIYQ